MKVRKSELLPISLISFFEWGGEIARFGDIILEDNWTEQ